MLNVNETKMSCKIRTKICGITRVDDAKMVADAGADAIGIVFYPPSSRYVGDLRLAANIAKAVGPFVTVVGLFVDESPENVERVLESVPLGLLQFHGNENAEYCEQFRRPYLKAIRMKQGINVEEKIAHYPNANGILLDAYRKGVPGGTGESFDWERVPHDSDCPIVLAGGLRPDNVSAAVKVARPWAVDVSGGVEASPGVKDDAKILAFLAKVNS